MNVRKENRVSMFGLRITPSFWQGKSIWSPENSIANPDQLRTVSISDDHSSFLLFFRPILETIKSLYWYVALNEPFIDFTSTDFEDGTIDHFEAHADSWMFPPGKLFPRYTNRVKEDWCYLIGFDHVPRDFEKNQEAQDILKNPPSEFNLALLNSDGAHWDVFSRSAELSNSIREHIQGLGPPFKTQTISVSDFLND